MNVLIKEFCVKYVFMAQVDLRFRLHNFFTQTQWFPIELPFVIVFTQFLVVSLTADSSVMLF